MLLPERTAYALVLYAIIVALVAVYRPAPLFLKDSKVLRRFGTAPGDTMASLGVTVTIAAIVSVAAFAFVDATAG